MGMGWLVGYGDGRWIGGPRYGRPLCTIFIDDTVLHAFSIFFEETGMHARTLSYNEL